MLACVSIFGSLSYPGNSALYLIFCFLYCAFLLLAWRTKFFFMVYLSAFLFLGFWLKINFTQLFLKGKLFEPVGYFDYSTQLYDKVLLVSSIGVLGFISATCLMSLKRHFLSSNLKPEMQTNLNSRNYALAWFLLFVACTTSFFINDYYEIYHRSSKLNDLLPAYIQNAVKWLLLIGLSLSALALVNISLTFKNTRPYLFFTLALLVDFLCNLSLLSRAFPVSGLAMLVAFFILSNFHLRLQSPKIFAIPLIAFLSFSVISVFSANIIRGVIYQADSNLINSSPFTISNKKDFDNLVLKVPSGNHVNLLVGRWIGLEGVASIVSYPDKDLSLFLKALNESKNYDGPSFYDSTIVSFDTPYSKIAEKVNYYAITLPGVIGFSYYLGSYWLVFLITFLFGVLGILFELLFLRIGTYPLVVASLSFLLSYRLVSFGYAPKDSITYFLSLMVVGIIAISMKRFQFIDLFIKKN